MSTKTIIVNHSQSVNTVGIGRLPNSGVTPSEFTIVYAIMAKWSDRSLAEALPFFSKINLRRCTRDLTRMGYNVLYKRISEGKR